MGRLPLGPSEGSGEVKAGRVIPVSPRLDPFQEKEGLLVASPALSSAPDEEPTVPGADCLWLLTFAPDQVHRSPLRGPLIRSRRQMRTDIVTSRASDVKGGQRAFRFGVRRLVAAFFRTVVTESWGLESGDPEGSPSPHSKALRWIALRQNVVTIRSAHRTHFR